MVVFHQFRGGFVSPMRAALYARVSTHDQHTLAMQMDAMHEFATRRGWMVTDAVEEIASGAKDHRPKRQALLKAAKQRQLDVILVWKLDRWGRSLVDLMMTLHELTALGSGLSRSRRRSISRRQRDVLSLASWRYLRNSSAT